MLRLWLAMGVGVSCLMASGVIASLARAQPSDPVAVITAYEMARNRRDIDGALAYFAENAVITQRSANFTGKEEIRKFLDGVASRSRFIVVSDRHTNGTHVTWTERSGTTGPEPQARLGGASAALSAPNAFSVNVEAVVQDGKIQSLAYLFGTPAPRSDPAQDGRSQLPAVIGLAAVVAVLLAVVMVASMGFRSRGRIPSSLHGRLMQDLRGWASARQ